MNSNTLGRSNSKGQVVIPKKYRDELGIQEGALLTIAISGRGVYISPIDEGVLSSDSRKLYIEVLKKTAGSWSQDTWFKTESRRKKIELKASSDRKKKW